MKFSNFTLPNNNEGQFDLYQYQGDSWLLILFFRGAWCVLCKKQLQELQSKIKDLQNTNIKVVAISNDSKLKSSLLQNFFHLSFPVISDRGMEIINREHLATQYKDQIVAKPAYYIIDQNHEILFQYTGATYDDRLSVNQILTEIKKLQS